MSETLPTQRKPDAAPAITSIEIRVYFEDTDVTGRIYHASYLRFLERGRTEWLRRLGFRHSEIAGSSSVFFVVRKLQIDYLAPGFMDEPSPSGDTSFRGKRRLDRILPEHLS